jgi:hypothetical protein
MGRRMFSGGKGPWEDDPNEDAWWGDEPRFHHPVFILTHHARGPVTKQGGHPGRAQRKLECTRVLESPAGHPPQVSRLEVKGRAG